MNIITGNHTCDCYRDLSDLRPSGICITNLKSNCCMRRKGNVDQQVTGSRFQVPNSKFQVRRDRIFLGAKSMKRASGLTVQD